MINSIPDHIGSKLSKFESSDEEKRVPDMYDDLESKAPKTESNKPKRRAPMAKKRKTRTNMNGGKDESIDLSYLNEPEPEVQSPEGASEEVRDESTLEITPHVQEDEAGDESKISSVIEANPKKETKSPDKEKQSPARKAKPASAGNNSTKKKPARKSSPQKNKQVSNSVKSADQPKTKETTVNREKTEFPYRDKLKEQERLARIERNKYLDDLSKQTREFLDEVRQEYGKK